MSLWAAYVSIDAITGPCSLELISQNQPIIQQCFSLTTNQHQQQPQKPLAEQDCYCVAALAHTGLSHSMSGGVTASP
jgi:hypothetical protein